MKHSAIVRFLLIGLLVSVVLGMASFYGLRLMNESSTAEVRRHMIVFIAQTVESGPYADSVQDSHLRGGGLRNPHRPSDRPPGGSNLWVFSGQGQVLASNVDSPPPVAWSSLKKPTYVHEFTFYYRLFHLIPDLTLVKLEPPEGSKADVFLLMEPRRQGSPQLAVWIDIAFFLFVGGVAIFIAFALIYVYLRRKSEEARGVLARLEKGDLQARFEIKRIDEIGSLMHDFNRMASEIERLVHRVQDTENARKDLLSELSHDIRTPLTSLKTSIETLYEHLDVMPKEEQREFLEVSRAELNYFVQLIDDLFFIADLGEPRYKQATQRIDLLDLLHEETKSRQSQGKISDLNRESHVKWDLNLQNLSANEAVILGDPLLIRRLFKNVLDNAAKHARTRVELQLMISAADNRYLVKVIDDGPGISDEAIALFGSRRKQRLSNVRPSQGISLGLGSVIMKTILELHGGALRIDRYNGTQVSIILPRP
jgi:signal transduction histidine kinase